MSTTVEVKADSFHRSNELNEVFVQKPEYMAIWIFLNESLSPHSICEIMWLQRFLIAVSVSDIIFV